MRLKIQSVPPLPVLKVWFTPGEQCTTVANLKSALAREVFALKQKSASPLELSLDGFDLLEVSPLHDVLRDGDLVLVKTTGTSTVGKKRKRSASPKYHKEKTRSLPPPRPPTLSSSSSSSASSSSSSSSSVSSSSTTSSSDTESDSDSDSSSSSSSSAGSSIPPQPSASPKRVLIPQTQSARKTTTHAPTPKATVPPGKGKPSTHSRNQRRKLKAKMQGAASSAPLPNFVSAANATPVPTTEAGVEERAKEREGRIRGPAPDVASALNNAFGGNERAGRFDPGALDASPVSASSSTLHTLLYPPSEAEETLNVQMLSMLPKSKNKNKSHRGAGDVDPRSRKIVFGTPPPPEQQISSQNGVEEEEAREPRPALIPPSSLPAHLIPSNMFITCVDVEEGLKKPKKKKRRADEVERWAMTQPVSDTIVLDYGEEEDSAMVTDEPCAQTSLDLTAIDFGAAPFITSHTELTEMCIIGFEGLLMNMKTFTPEIGKRYGRVLSWSENVVTIRPIFEGEEDMDEDEDLEWSEVQGKWKLLQ